MSIALENALNAINEYAAGNTHPNASLIAAKCRGLMRGYDARWRNVDYEVLAVESLVESDLWNPETNRKSRTFSLAGKLDVVIQRGYRREIIDHKTTSEDITDSNSPYWRQLVIEGQVSHYMLLEWLNGRKADGACWDVVRKPGISPKKLSKKDAEAFVFTTRYFGYQFDKDVTLAVASDEDHRETLEMYEVRLAQDCSTDRPEWYFQRRSIPRLDADIHEYATELWEHSQEIIHARATDRHARNSGACLMYGRPCRFLGICSGHDEPDSQNWTKKQQVHAELPLMETDGRDVLTNSRIRTFQTCRRKHFYQYELGIERVDEEEQETLYFGSTWHAGLEAWFKTFQQLNPEGETNGNNDNDSTGNELATVSVISR